MNANTSAGQTKWISETMSGITWKQLLRFLIFALSTPAILFLAAGRWNWVMGWVYVGILAGTTVVSRILMARTSPELITERAQSLDREDVSGWDRAIVIFLAMFGPLAVWIVAGLDERFGWSPEMPLALQAAAVAVVVLGYLLGAWALVVNKFFSAVIRIQKERGHTVVTGGPYRYVRHPGYVGGIATCFAVPLLLGSLWALIPAGLAVIAVVIRTALEDRTLHEELPGYAEYAARVRYRLLPGVW
jgi:protein-S-isoprenylcysteine O-methyltransferase Ste14